MWCGGCGGSGALGVVVVCAFVVGLLVVYIMEEINPRGHKLTHLHLNPINPPLLIGIAPKNKTALMHKIRLKIFHKTPRIPTHNLTHSQQILDNVPIENLQTTIKRSNIRLDCLMQRDVRIDDDRIVEGYW